MASNNFKRGDVKEHWTKMLRHTMETPAWRALSTNAQALYPWLKLEWHGKDNNNNGKIRLSVRQAADRLGVSINTAMKAFHELQAKGFLIVKETACLGIGGNAKGHSFVITELGYTVHNGNTEERGRQIFRDWREGHDFPIVKALTNNPAGRNGRTKKKPVLKSNTDRHKDCDGSEISVINSISGRLKPCYVSDKNSTPTCNRRCAILYPVKCRLCLGLHYASEHEGNLDRLLRKAIKHRAKHGQSKGGIAVPFPGKPKRMRWHTYFRARKRAEAHEARIIAGFHSRFY